MESSSREEMKQTIAELLSLVDGAVEVVALFGHRSDVPSQKKWSKDWLEGAAKYGCTIEP